MTKGITSKERVQQAFRFMVGPGHCLIISKYDPSLSKAVDQVDPSSLVVKKSHFNKIYSFYSESTDSTKQLSIQLNMSKAATQKGQKNKDLKSIKSIAECSPWSILQYF